MFTSGIHGCAMQIERPDWLSFVRRKGQGITIVGQPGTKNVFHFPIPMFLDRSTVACTVAGARLYFSAGKGVTVTHVYVNDGSDALYAQKDVNLTGDHKPWKTSFQPPWKKAKKGLSIVVHVQFAEITGVFPNIKIPDTHIDFEAAGILVQEGPS